MKKQSRIILIIGFIYGLTGCQSMQSQPYSPAPESVSISGNPSIGYRVDSITLKHQGISPSPESLEFCFAQNIPGITGQPTLNPSKTKITAQGRDQVSFIIPMTMGTPLNYDILFTTTASTNQNLITLEFNNLRIKGTWSANEVPLPGSKEAHLYVDSALDKFQKINGKIVNCLLSES